MANLPDGVNDPPSIYPLVPHAANAHCKVFSFYLSLLIELNFVFIYLFISSTRCILWP